MGEFLVAEKIKKSSKIFIALILLIVIFAGIYKFVIPSISIALGENTKLIVQARLDKYINYNLSDIEKGTLVQYTLKTGVESEDDTKNYLIGSNKLNISLSKIDGKFPENAKIIAKNDNKDGYNYSYNKEKGIVNLKIEDAKNAEEYLYNNVNVKQGDLAIFHNDSAGDNVAKLIRNGELEITTQDDDSNKYSKQDTDLIYAE